jgi:hypothetical protein
VAQALLTERGMRPSRRSEVVTEFVMSPLLRSENPATLEPDELRRRADLLHSLALRLSLFATQKLRPSEELGGRVKALLSRFPDVPMDVRLAPGTPLCGYFNARCTLVHTARALAIVVD